MHGDVILAPARAGTSPDLMILLHPVPPNSPSIYGPGWNTGCEYKAKRNIQLLSSIGPRTGSDLTICSALIRRELELGSDWTEQAKVYQTRSYCKGQENGRLQARGTIYVLYYFLCYTDWRPRNPVFYVEVGTLRICCLAVLAMGVMTT